MNGWILFLVGWLWIPLLVLGTVTVCRAWQNWDPEGPGTSRALRMGCTCDRRANWYGLREAVMERSVLARACPVICHHPDVRRRMFLR